MQTLFAQDKSRSAGLLFTVVLGIASELKINISYRTVLTKNFCVLKKVLHMNGPQDMYF